MQGRVGTFLSQIRRAPLKFRSRGTATKQMQSVDMVVVQECVVHCSTYMGQFLQGGKNGRLMSFLAPQVL